MEKVKQTIQEVLKLMGISFDDIEISLNDVGSHVFSIKTGESSLLIGHNGEHFLALSHVIKKIASTYISDDTDFSIDVNNYRAGQVAKLKQKALMLADRARSFKTAIEMEPASSYERMLVHALFTETPDIKTESQGVGSKRHVVIKFDPDKTRIL